jgi:hypothetical protein
MQKRRQSTARRGIDRRNVVYTDMLADPIERFAKLRAPEMK